MESAAKEFHRAALRRSSSTLRAVHSLSASRKCSVLTRWERPLARMLAPSTYERQIPAAARTLPLNRFIRAAETFRHPLVMWQVVDDGPDRELALHVKLRLEFARREQESIHCAA